MKYQILSFLDEIIDKEITADKQKNFLKKTKNVDSNSENKDLAIADTNKHENSISNGINKKCSFFNFLQINNF